MSEQLITLKRTDDQIALIKAMASKDRATAYEAQAAVADLMGPIISQVINAAPTITNLYTNMPFGEDENPSIPLDLYHNLTADQTVRVYSQSAPGGLAYSEIYPSHDELKFKTYTLDTAVAFNKKHARKSRLDVVSATFSRIAQEVLYKQEKTAANEMLYALCKADTNYDGTGAAAGNHVISATTANQFTLDDFNKLMTRSKRLWSAFNHGTPMGGIQVGITDLIVSPEIVQEIRSMAYNPVNVRAVPNTDESTVLAAPDSVREALMNAGGLPTFFGINIMEMLEFGVNQRYNRIFAATNVEAGSPVTFTQANDEIAVSVDRRKPGMWRPVIREEGTGSEISLQPDDQFAVRQDKIGFYGSLEEGRILTEDRQICGVVI